MPTTLNPACPLCGLRFGNNPLLDLHVREDHRQRVSAQDANRGAGSTRAPASEAGRPAAAPSSDGKTATAGPARHGGRGRQAMTALRRALRALR